eukprot:SAG31_NODE_1930_length_6881_cov_6.976998_5_plen_57_part_00
MSATPTRVNSALALIYRLHTSAIATLVSLVKTAKTATSMCEKSVNFPRLYMFLKER